MTPPKIIVATPYSKGDKTEFPIRFIVAKYAKGTNPHPYMVGKQVKSGSPDHYIGTAHYFIEEDAMNVMLEQIARHNKGHTDKWISYIPPTVKRI